MERNENSGADEPFGDWIDQDPSENAIRLAKSMDEVLNDGSVSAIDEYHADDLRYFKSSDESGSTEELKSDVRMFLRAFPDLKVTIKDAFADSDDEDEVTIHYETIPPTKQQVKTKGIGIAEFDGDEIVKLDIVFDNLGLLQHIGVLK